MNRRLYRSPTDSVLGGVAGGVAEYLDVDPSIVRIVWAILAIVTGGIFFVVYIVMWIVVPEGHPEPYVPGPGAQPGWTPPSGPSAASPAGGTDPAAAPGEAPPTPSAPAAPAAWTPPAADPYAGRRHRHRRSGNGGLIFGIILVALGVWFLLDNYIPDLRSDLLWPIGLVVLGLVLLVVSTRRSSEES